MTGAVALLAVALAGCGASGASAATKAADRSYLVDIRSADPTVGLSDTQLLRLGSAACTGFAANVSYFDLADSMQVDNPYLPTTDLGAIITTAADDLCPKYRSRVS